MSTDRLARDRLAVATGVAALAAGMAALHLLGRGVLGAPPVGTFDDLVSWATERGPVTVGLTLARLVALGVGYHLIATTALGLVGRVLDRPRLAAWAERATLPLFRSTVRRAAGLGLSTAAVLVTPLPRVGAVPTTVADQVVVERLAADDALPRTTVILEKLGPDGDAPGVASLRAIASGPTAPTGEATLRVVPTVAPDDRHVVRPGDHLWALAEHRLTGHLGREPTDAEVGRYWRQVVAANPQLTDPDLLFAGDTVHIPSLTPSGTDPGGQATLRLEPG